MGCKRVGLRMGQIAGKGEEKGGKVPYHHEDCCRSGAGRH